MQNSERDFEFNGFESPLRPSLFDGLPPFINYVPSNGIDDVTKKPAQYWDVNEVSIEIMKNLVIRKIFDRKSCHYKLISKYLIIIIAEMGSRTIVAFYHGHAELDLGLCFIR